MRILRQDDKYRSDTDVLIRVYKNQAKSYPEEQQIACEILFRDHILEKSVYFTSQYPRGAVVALVGVLNIYANRNWKVQLSNELDDDIGVLTSCRANFEQSFEWENLNKSIKFVKDKRA